MKLNDFKKQGVLLVSLLWLAGIGVLWAEQHVLSTQGKEIMLKVVPVDPRDTLRGDYVTLRYEISSIPSNDPRIHFSMGHDAVAGTYVVLSQKNGEWEIKRVTKKRPGNSDEIFLKAKSYSWSLTGEKNYKQENVPSEKVSTSFFRTGDTKIELLETTDPEGAVGRFIKQRGEGIHHLAFEVDDIRAEMKRLKERGIKILSEEPFKGADNKLVCFLHPKSCNGVLIELCQEISPTR